MTSPRVVAGIDGSPAAEAAIRWAVTEAMSRGATLSLVHAFTWPGYPRPLIAGELPPAYWSGADQVVQTSVDFARKLEPSLEIEGSHVDGSPAAVLSDASEDADVVVIGTRCLEPAASTVMRSSGLRLTATAHCPVVVVRPDPVADSNDHVLVGYDGSPASLLALDFGLEHSRRYHLKLRVATTERHQAEIRDRDGCEAAELVQLHGRPAEQLLRLSTDARLIVVGARGLGGFTGLLLGSVCQIVVHRATCPVAVIPTAMIGG